MLKHAFSKYAHFILGTIYKLIASVYIEDYILIVSTRKLWATNELSNYPGIQTNGSEILSLLFVI